MITNDSALWRSLIKTMIQAERATMRCNRELPSDQENCWEKGSTAGPKVS